MTAWPASLPQDTLASGFAQQQSDTAIRSGMSYGPDKVRRRTTAAIKTVTIPLRLTTAQLATLDTFYNTTIQVTGTVDWKDHITGAAAEYRFLGPPAIAPYGGGFWAVTLNMEMLP